MGVSLQGQTGALESKRSLSAGSDSKPAEAHIALCPLDCMQKYSSTDSRLSLYLLLLCLVFRFARGRSGWEGARTRARSPRRYPFVSAAWSRKLFMDRYEEMRRAVGRARTGVVGLLMCWSRIGAAGEERKRTMPAPSNDRDDRAERPSGDGMSRSLIKEQEREGAF